jgi:hypothetical protein
MHKQTRRKQNLKHKSKRIKEENQTIHISNITLMNFYLNNDIIILIRRIERRIKAK